ncbi:MAG: hypothetical protein HY791_22420 [Deltaproteobacteria bacterium]|nr:hypothetical protein [Deltaproteobacteria bacterium]
MIDRPGRVQNIQAYCARVETTDEAFVYLALAEAPNGIRTWAAVPLHEIECVSRDELLDARPGDFWTVWTWSDDGRDRLFVEVATPTAPTLQEQVELDDLIERLKLSSP